MIDGEYRDGRLAVFDVEGVIIPKRRYLLLQAYDKLGIVKVLNISFLGFLYEIGFLTLDRALKGVYRFFEGISMEEFYRTLGTTPIIPGVHQLFRRLRDMGYRIALISSGIPDFLVEELAEKLGADYAHGIEMGVEGGKITGEICGEVIEAYGKAKVLKRILREGSFHREDCVVVADDRNNCSMIPLVGKTIGYNPDSLMAARCDYVVRGRLLDVLPYFGEDVTDVRLSYAETNVLREIIHIGSFLIPLLCHFLNFNRYLFAALVLAVAVAYAFSELARGLGVNLPPFTRITEMASIGEEKWKFATSPLLFALGIITSLLINPPQRGYAAITILTIGDSTARLVGKRVGKRVLPYNQAKRVEGAVAGALLSMSASLFFVSLPKAFASSTICMIVESLPLPINDNLLIPLVAGLVLTAFP